MPPSGGIFMLSIFLIMTLCFLIYVSYSGLLEN